MMGIGPLIPWRKSDKKILFKKLLFPLGISLLIALSLLIIIGIKNFIPIIAFTSIGFALSSICYEWISDTKIRISSGDKILNCNPIILDGVVLDLDSAILILVLEIFRLFFQFILN